MAESRVPTSTEELLADIEREWTALMDVVARLSPAQMTAPDEGGWSPKDNLAHLGEWMTVLMGYHIDRRPSHEALRVSPEIVKGWDFEIINPVLFARHRDQSADEVLAELRRIYGDLIARLGSMPFEDLLEPRHPEDPEKRPVLMWVLGDTTEHFAEHRATIEKML
ncbi:MAG TPA: ClbS/DfsB family four-helix bundle protein [Anaerolineales bacterium]|jgi:hypothetical protein